MKATEEPPRWDTSILHESFDSRSYRDAIELHAAGMTRLEALFDEFSPSAVAVERVFFQHNTRTAMSVGQASGIVLALAVGFLAYKDRMSDLCLQDRIIRLEMQVRLHKLGLGEQADKLSLRQLISLRFASDAEPRMTPEEQAVYRDKVVPLLRAKGVRMIHGISAASLGGVAGKEATTVIGIVDANLAKGIRGIVDAVGA